MTEKPLISIVTPFYNEGEAIEIYRARVTELMASVPDVRFEVVCIDDGSRDETLDRLRAIVAGDARFRAFSFSRNFGKEAAMSAGLDQARGDAVIPVDADLQDPPELIPRMSERWREGYEVVLARRANRDSDSLSKRVTAVAFYRIHRAISAVAIPDNVGDYRLMDRVVVEALKALPERCRFMKGLFAWAGFRTATVDYVRPPRAAGETKFSGWRLWNFALEGITSFSTVPLRIWSYLGGAIALLGVALALAAAIGALLTEGGVPGVAATIAAVLFLGGVQLVGIGVLGEYVGRIYLETKQRPLYLIRERIEREG